jgi:hypothetical protein
MYDVLEDCRAGTPRLGYLFLKMRWEFHAVLVERVRELLSLSHPPSVLRCHTGSECQAGTEGSKRILFATSA